MKGMQWVGGAVALMVFDVALIYGVRHWQERYVPAAELPADPPAPTEPVRTVGFPPAAPPLQSACMDGVTWVYDTALGYWLKLEPVLKCDVGDVRKVLQSLEVNRSACHFRIYLKSQDFKNRVIAKVTISRN